MAAAANGTSPTGPGPAPAPERKPTPAEESPALTAGPPPLDQLWKSFTPSMSLEMMALLLQEQIREMRSHLAKKLADTGGQSSPEIVRWEGGKRRGRYPTPADMQLGER